MGNSIYTHYKEGQGGFSQVNPLQLCIIEGTFYDAASWRKVLFLICLQ